MDNNFQICECGSRALNLVDEQIHDFWEAHDECVYGDTYTKPKGTHSAECVCGDSITSFPDDWYEMWKEIHGEHNGR